jgi:phosphocarrier protein HPr
MLETTMTINHPVGLHARPAALFVKTAQRFQAEITLEKEGRQVNAKGILGILTLGVSQGDTVTLRVSGSDEQEAVAALCQLVETNFDDPDENRQPEGVILNANR